MYSYQAKQIKEAYQDLLDRTMQIRVVYMLRHMEPVPKDCEKLLRVLDGFNKQYADDAQFANDLLDNAKSHLHTNTDTIRQIERIYHIGEKDEGIAEK